MPMASCPRVSPLVFDRRQRHRRAAPTRRARCDHQALRVTCEGALGLGEHHRVDACRFGNASALLDLERDPAVGDHLAEELGEAGEELAEGVAREGERLHLADEYAVEERAVEQGPEPARDAVGANLLGCLGRARCGEARLALLGHELLEDAGEIAHVLFFKEVARARALAPEARSPVGGRREQHHGDVRGRGIFVEEAAEHHPVQPGHPQIGDHRIGAQIERLGRAGLAIASDIHLPTRFFEERRHDREERVGVVDDENPPHETSFSPSSGSPSRLVSIGRVSFASGAP